MQLGKKNAKCEYSRMESRGLALPRIAQELDFTCGVACVRSVLEYFTGQSRTELALATEMGVIEAGYSKLENLLATFSAHGLDAATSQNNSLKNLANTLNRGEVSMVSFFDDEVGHYGLVKEITATEIVLMDPWVAREGVDHRMSLAEFEGRWYCQAPLKNYEGHAIRIRGAERSEK